MEYFAEYANYVASACIAAALVLVIYLLRVTPEEVQKRDRAFFKELYKQDSRR